MKKSTKLLLALWVLLFSALNLQAGNLQAYLSYSIFNTPDNQPYVETYLTVKGSSVNHSLQTDGSYQGMIDIQMIFKISGTDSIVNFAKYELLGPTVKDTNDISMNFLDVQRFGLPIGSYDLEFSIKDRNSSKDPFVNMDAFTIDFSEEAVAFSDIEFLTSFEKTEETGVFVKNGYSMFPYVFNYYPQSNSKLNFYAELYNSNKVLGDDDFLLSYYIRPFEVDKKMDQYYFNKKRKASAVNPLLTSIDISNLPSGNYLLVLEARDRKNEILTQQQLFFQRYNPTAEFSLNNLIVLNVENTFVGKMTSRDTLVQYIDYLVPISTDIERNYAKTQVETADLESLQKYFLNFWLERDQMNPQQAWLDYKLRVDQVNVTFKTPSIQGYATDRGRVYLQYGSPDVMSEQHNEPGAYPYEIWHYYVLNGQRDKKFVFFTHDLATNDFHLIHSNAIGELPNYRWQAEIYRRADAFYSVDQIAPNQSWGNKASDYYYQPR